MGYKTFSTAFLEMLRPNRFYIDGGFFGDGMYIKAASIPGYNIGTATAWHAGQAFELAGDIVSEPWEVTCALDIKSTAYNMIWNHMQLLWNSQNKTSSNDWRTYRSDVEVSMILRDGTTDALKFKLTNAWPTIISPLDLDHGSNDSIAEFSITLNYSEMIKLV